MQIYNLFVIYKMKEVKQENFTSFFNFQINSGMLILKGYYCPYFTVMA